jgi:hypothetical protein
MDHRTCFQIASGINSTFWYILHGKQSFQAYGVRMMKLKKYEYSNAKDTFQGVLAWDNEIQGKRYSFILPIRQAKEEVYAPHLERKGVKKTINTY